MKQETAKRFGAAAGAVVLASSALAGVGTAVAAESAQAPEAGAAAVEAAGAAASQAGVQQAAVAGDFSFDQAVVSSNATISGVFAQAASALCASAPQYAVRCACGNVIGADGSGGLRYGSGRVGRKEGLRRAATSDSPRAWGPPDCQVGPQALFCCLLRPKFVFMVRHDSFFSSAKFAFPVSRPGFTWAYRRQDGVCVIPVRSLGA